VSFFVVKFLLWDERQPRNLGSQVKSMCTTRGLAAGAVVLAALLPMLAGAARAQEVGTVAAVEPLSEIGREGAWTKAALGSPIHQGDTLRTGPAGRLRVVLQDDSVVNLANNSQLVVDESVFQPDEGAVHSVLELLKGKIRTFVSDYYTQPNANFEVHTPTAVSGVRGTDFVVVYEPVTEVTDVVDVTGRVAVNSVVALRSSGVYVTSREITTVAKGKLPTPPRPLTETLFRQYLDGLEFIGAGRPESLAFTQPFLSGDDVAPPDRAEVVGAPILTPETVTTQVGNPATQPNVSSLVGQPPAVIQGLPGNLNVHF
jgi:ferric-dicitrate binding protein FerR (iron transport regulator)